MHLCMDGGDGTGPVRRIATPPSARAISSLERVDYEDTFLVDVGDPGQRTATQWARAVLEGAPLPVRGALETGWTALGLRLGGGRPEDRVLGWPVELETPDVLLLAAGSRIGMPGQLLFRREDEGLLFATFVHHGNVAARAVWASTVPAHVPTVRRLLKRVARPERQRLTA